MPRRAKRHRNTVARSIRAEGSGKVGCVEVGVHRAVSSPVLPQNWRRVPISFTISVCFPVDKISARGNPPFPTRCCLGYDDGEGAILIAATSPHCLFCSLFLGHCAKLEI